MFCDVARDEVTLAERARWPIRVSDDELLSLCRARPRHGRERARVLIERLGVAHAAGVRACVRRATT